MSALLTIQDGVDVPIRTLRKHLRHTSLADAPLTEVEGLGQIMQTLAARSYDWLILVGRSVDQPMLEQIRRARSEYPTLSILVVVDQWWFQAELDALDHGADEMLEAGALTTGQLERALARAGKRRPRCRLCSTGDVPVDLPAAAIEAAADLILIADTDGSILHANPACREATGFSPAELRGRSLTCLSDGKRTAQRMQAIIKRVATGRPWRGRLRSLPRQGSTQISEVTVAPICDSHDNITHLILVKRDVTRRVNMFQAMRAAQRELAEKNEELEQFVYAASHDLKSPLVSLSGFANYIRQDVRQGRHDRIEEMCDRMVESSRKMTSMIDDLLELCRAGMDDKDADHRADMAQIAQEVQSNLAGLIDSHQATIEVQADLPMVRIPPVRVTQILQNLLSNAVRYGCPQPGMTVTISHERRRREHVFSVRDDGPGIDERHHERIFKLFSRLDDQEVGSGGVGLGLVRRIVQQYGGQVAVDSQPGQGAEFTFTLPNTRIECRNAPRPTGKRVDHVSE